MEEAIIVLVLVGIGLQGIQLWQLRKVRQTMATQEEQLQDAQALLNTVAVGVTEIISRLNTVPPSENPAIQDEIDGIKGVAQGMADQINAVLNPPPTEG